MSLANDSLALAMYLVVRGGLLSVESSAKSLNPYGVGAISVLAGMFSKQAMDKLNEVFTALFRTQGIGDDQRLDNVDGSQPEASATSSE